MVSFFATWCSKDGNRGFIVEKEDGGSTTIFWPTMSTNRSSSNCCKVLVPFLNVPCVGTLSKHDVGTFQNCNEDPIILTHCFNGDSNITFTLGVMDADGYMSTGSDYA